MCVHAHKSVCLCLWLFLLEFQAVNHLGIGRICPSDLVGSVGQGLWGSGRSWLLEGLGEERWGKGSGEGVPGAEDEACLLPPLLCFLIPSLHSEKERG